MLTTHNRTTKYVVAVRDYMKQAGHGTNAEIIDALRLDYPDLSATTVHRITTRLLDGGKLRLAPSGKDNVMRFDANLSPHDHFMCNRCGKLRDATFGAVIRPFLENEIGDGCSISGDLTVSGLCKECKLKGGKNENNNL